MGLFKKASKVKDENTQEDENIKVKKCQEKKWSFTKRAITFVIINAELQIWASYCLAFLGRDAIAEALSQQIVITIVGTMIGYFAKSLMENLSKYTTMFGKNLQFDEAGNIVGQSEMRNEMCNDMPDVPVEVNTERCDGTYPIETNNPLM